MDVFCVKCRSNLKWYERITIVTLEPKYEKGIVSGTRDKTVDRFNLCKSCYKKYQQYTVNFFNEVDAIS